MPVPNRARRRQYGTIDPREAQKPSTEQLRRKELIDLTLSFIDVRLGEYMRHNGKDERWATPVRAYYECLIVGRKFPGTIRLDATTKQLVHRWVDEARQTTGLTPPNRATRPKRKKR